MVRAFGCVCMVFAFLLFVGGQADAQAQKNQMVKGTVKVVDVDKDVLIINQKLKGQVVDRELSILDTTEFVVMVGKETKKVVGKQGLRLLEGGEGSNVNVKCDKDVNVLQVKVTLKKK
jgi:hypothetical protein